MSATRPDTTFQQEVTIVHTRFANQESGFAVLDADAEDGPVVLVGPLVHLEERERVQVVGTWVTDPRFGEQVKVLEAHPVSPTDRATLAAYLRRVRHIGRRRADALLDRFGAEGVLEAIDREPAAAFRAAGLSHARASEAAAAWNGMRVTRQLHLLLAPHGLGYLVKRIHVEYGSSAYRVLTANPYELTRVFGVGFLTADRIARAASLSTAGVPGRRRAAIVHLLGEAERGGSTCRVIDGLLRDARELLGEDVDAELVSELETAGDVVREGEWIYRTATAELEAELAERVRAMLSDETSRRLRDPGAEVEPGDAGLEAGIPEETDPSRGEADPQRDETDPRDEADPQREETDPRDEIGSQSDEAVLTAEQHAAVRAAFTERLSVITGGPGTGKTATIRTIAKLAERQHAHVVLVAPTGRAAARMRESSGLAASTVHSALGWIPGEGPSHDEDDPVKCDLLILDESSMANLELMVALLRAIPRRAHVVLVGDADQLAPVGAGKPFADLVASERVPTARLTHIFRQAAGSMIVLGAHAIRAGRVPEFTPGEGMRRDLFLIERRDALAAREEIVSLVTRRLPEHYGVDPVSDIQVFAPVYRGDLGIDALNTALRERLNPAGTPVGGGRLRIGDKLMMTGRNLHELGLMNGTVLRLLDELDGVAGEDGALLLESEESLFRFPLEEVERLRLAYACSVHRGQGIELPIAIIVAHPAAGAYFLRREMLYTAVTRAKLATIVVGTREVIARAARSTDTDTRVSRLAERLLAG